MAGSGFTIDVRDFSAAVRRLSSRELAETASRAAADIIKGRAEGAFRHPELRPAPWPPRKDRSAKAGKSAGRSAKKARKPHALMIDTGNLMGSFSVVSSGKGWKIVSSANYAPYHQFGTSKMPARPMLPFDKQGNLLDAAKEDVETAMMQGVVKMAKELGFKVKGMK